MMTKFCWLAKPVPRLLLAGTILCASGASWAGRPLVTEDAGVLEQRDCELESFVAQADNPDLNLRWAQIGCGVGNGTQLAIAAGKETSDGPEVNYLALSGKTVVRELTDDRAGVVIAYALLGGKAQDNKFSYASTDIKAVLTVPHYGWLLHANAGFLHTNAGVANRFTWALAAERLNALGPVALMGEIFGTDKDTPWLQLAARWPVIADRFFLDVSWGRELEGSDSRLVTFGMKLAF